LKTQETYTVRTGVLAKLKDLALLFKLRVNLLVMISALLGYALGVPVGGFNAVDALLLAIGGLLVAGSSVAFNEVIEVEQDTRMARTKDRPLVSGSMGMGEAITIAVVAGAAGTFILWSAFGQFTAVLSLLTLFIYVALYTPLKRLSPWATFVGAIPGAFPPLLGYVAATGTFGLAGGLLFALQFLWQFPHFWSISWALHDDYAKAGYHLLPSKGGRDRYSAFLLVLYTLFLLFTGLLPWAFGITGHWSALVASVLGLVMLLHALRLLRTLAMADARRLMFAGFFYLPLVLLACVLDKL